MFTLTGTLESHAGAPHAGVAVSVEPHPAVNPDPTADVTYAMGWEGKTDDLGHFTVQLETFPGLTYLLRSAVTSPQRFVAPADGVTLDITDIIPIYAPEPMVPYLQALNATGQPEGHVPTAQGDDTWAWAAGGVPDTGVRNVAALVTNGTNFYLDWGHELTISRIGQVVYLTGVLFGKVAPAIHAPTGFVVPIGFRPVGNLEFPAIQGGSPTLVVRARIPLGFHLPLSRTSGGDDWPDGAGYSFNTSYLTPDPWPTTLPGVALP